MLLFLRFVATDTFMDAVGELMGVTKATAFRATERVLEALLAVCSIELPNQEN